MEKKGRVLWLLYACILCLCFSGSTAALTRLMGLSVQAYFLLTGLLAAAVLLFVYLPVKLLAAKKRLIPEWLDTKGKIPPAEWCFALLLAGGLVFVRLFWAPAGAVTDGQFCYEQAVLPETGTLQSFFLGELYIWLLHWAIVWLGQSHAVLILNLIFQTAGSFLLYLGIRLLSGTLCAAAAVLTILFLPAFANSTYVAEPQSLFLLGMGEAVLLAAFSLKAIAAQRSREQIKRMVCMTGFFIGILCFLDFRYLGVFLFVSVGFYLLRQKQRHPATILLTGAVMTLAGFTLLFLLAFVLFSDKTGYSMQTFWGMWLNAAFRRDFYSLLHSPTLTEYWLTIPVYLSAAFTLFQKDSKTENSGAVWIAPLCFYTCLELASKAPLQEQGMRFLFFGILAGHGILGMLKQEKLTMEGEKMKQENTAPTGRTEPKPGEYLENPLPVPRRHVKRDMDYAFEPSSDQMYYEVPVADNDDFDV